MTKENPKCSNCAYSEDRTGMHKLKCKFQLPGHDEKPENYNLVDPDSCCDLHKKRP